MVRRDQALNSQGRVLWKEPRLQKYIVQQRLILFFHHLSSRMEASESCFDGFVAYPRINLCGCQVGVTEQFLYCSDVRAAFEQVRSKTVPNHMRTDLADSGLPPELPYDASKGTTVHRALPLGAH
jgi:hypothetical protein